MGDLFNGWDEDGEPQGYAKRAREYYDRKVEKAEETAIFALKYGLLIGIIITLITMFYGLLMANTGPQEKRLEIHDCYEQGARAVMLSDGTIECREKKQ